MVLLHIRGMLSKALLNFDGVRRSPMRQSVMLELSSEVETTLYLKKTEKKMFASTCSVLGKYLDCGG